MAAKRWLALGAVVVVAVPVGCAADGDDEAAVDAGGADAAVEQPVEATPTAAFMAQVAENTAEAPAFEFTMSFEAEGVSELPSGPLMTAEGAFTDDGQRGEMTFEMGALAGSLGGTGMPGADELLGELSEPWEVVVDGDTTYVRGGLFGSMLGADTPWVSMPSGGGAKVDPTGGLDDPAALLDLLGEAGEVTEVGTEDIGGVEATHYAVDVDLEALAASAAEGAGATVPDIPGLDGTEVTLDVWVDEAGQVVRRMELLLSGEALTGGTGLGATDGSVRMTFDITPLDAPVEVDVPDPSEVTPVEELGGDLFGLGG